MFPTRGLGSKRRTYVYIFQVELYILHIAACYYDNAVEIIKNILRVFFIRIFSKYMLAPVL